MFVPPPRTLAHLRKTIFKVENIHLNAKGGVDMFADLSSESCLNVDKHISTVTASLEEPIALVISLFNTVYVSCTT
jgi:hypothetical protein